MTILKKFNAYYSDFKKGFLKLPEMEILLLANFTLSELATLIKSDEVKHKTLVLSVINNYSLDEMQAVLDDKTVDFIWSMEY